MHKCWIIAVALVSACGENEGADLPEPTASSGDPRARPAESPESARPMEGQWFARVNREGPWAGFGPPNSEAAFSARCEQGAMIFSTTEMPPSGPGETMMHLSAPGIEQSIPAVASEQGLPNTDARVEPSAQWLAKLQAASGNLSVRVGESDSLTVPISEPLTSLIRDCRR